MFLKGQTPGVWLNIVVHVLSVGGYFGKPSQLTKNAVNHSRSKTWLGISLLPLEILAAFSLLNRSGATRCDKYAMNFTPGVCHLHITRAYIPQLGSCYLTRPVPRVRIYGFVIIMFVSFTAARVPRELHALSLGCVSQTSVTHRKGNIENAGNILCNAISHLSDPQVQARLCLWEEADKRA